MTSERIGRVRTGTVKAGDVLHGYVVTGFGRTWVASDEDNGAYGAGPGERVEVCYAYGERVSAAVAAAPAGQLRLAQMRDEMERLDAMTMYDAGSTRKYNAIRERVAKLGREIASLSA